MTKPNSIRTAVNTKFLELLPQLQTIGGKALRRTVLDWSVETLKITMAAAATHYNHAFQRIKDSEPELVAGLGRPDDKNNGGRRKKTELTAKEVLSKPADELTPDLGEPQQVFAVKRKSDDVMVAEGLSFKDAKSLIEKNAAQKKAKLYFV